MKIVRLATKAVLCLVIGCSGLLYAQEHEAAKPAEPEARPADAPRPVPEGAARPEQAKPEEQAKPDEHLDRPEDKAARKDDKAVRQDNAKPAKEEARNAHNESRGRIPDDKFRANFGREHTFVVHRTIVNSHPQFRYGGYSFQIADAWPVGWAYSDPCYVDFIDGEYFLIDLAHPGVRLAIVVI